jgi:leader peptidase (prepilin peptidase)/N-methyltransferase
MNDIIRIGFLALLGWTAGVFVNYVADVFPIRRNLAAPFCLSCQSQISLINYIFWPRRCISCGNRRTWRVWVVELVYIFLTLWIWENPPDILGFWSGLVLLIYFGIVIIIDLEHRLIMHPISLVGVALGLYIGIVLHGLLDTIIGGIVGFGIMWLMYKFGELILRWISRLRGQELDEVALGFGDVNLSGVLGLMLGWPGIIVGLFIAILLGGIVSLLYMIMLLIFRKYQLFTSLPYGPFLVSGAFLMIFFTDKIINILGG